MVSSIYYHSNSNDDLFRWVNRKDPQGKNLFAGGFLGLDNIGKLVFLIVL